MNMKKEKKNKDNGEITKVFLKAVKVKKEVGIARQSKSSYTCKN